MPAARGRFRVGVCPACVRMDWEAQPALRRQPLLEGGEAADSSLSRSDLRPSFSRAFPGKARSLSSGIRLTPCPGLRRFLWTWTEETAAATPLHPLPTIAATLERAAPQSRQPHPPHQPLHVLADVPSRAILRPLFHPAPAPIRSDGGRLPENEGGGEPAPNRRKRAIVRSVGTLPSPREYAALR